MVREAPAPSAQLGGASGEEVRTLAGVGCMGGSGLSSGGGSKGVREKVDRDYDRGLKII